VLGVAIPVEAVAEQLADIVLHGLAASKAA
jgi:hypothetical protein